MKTTRWITLIALILGLLICLWILFRAFIFENIVQPISLLVWIFLRVISSVDQNIYWGILLFAGLIILFLRLGRSPAVNQPEPPLETFSALENIKYWRTAIMVTRGEITEVNVLKRYLGKMLATAYAVNMPGRANLEIYNAIKLRQISLPEPIYAFLFPGALPVPRKSFSQILQSIRQFPRRWANRWSGRELEEYYQSIEEVLTYIESTLEVRNDDEKSDSYNH
jgi:hypothetical protein